MCKAKPAVMGDAVCGAAFGRTALGTFQAPSKNTHGISAQTLLNSSAQLYYSS